MRPDGAHSYASETILDKYSTSRECELREIERETNPGIVLATGRPVPETMTRSMTGNVPKQWKINLSGCEVHDVERSGDEGKMKT